MPVAHSGRFWRPLFLILLVAVIGSYILYARREFPHGGSKMGVIYGIAGTLLILLLAAYGIRKRRYRSTFGTLEQWLQSHIYLGLLTMVILVLHTGFRFHDKIAVTTLALVAIVVLSGIAGAILYVSIPRLLTEIESDLTIPEMSDELNLLARDMARTASGRSAPFQRIYEELMRESKPGWMAGWRLLFTRMRTARKKVGADWSHLLGLVAKDEQEPLRQMLVLSRQHKELLLRLLYQQRYKNILEFWLFIHVPFTFVLLLFAVVHVAAVFYYGKVF